MTKPRIWAGNKQWKDKSQQRRVKIISKHKYEKINSRTSGRIHIFWTDDKKNDEKCEMEINRKLEMDSFSAE